jgi:hypothetical protein
MLDNILEIAAAFWQRPERRLSFIDDPHADRRHTAETSRDGEPRRT